MNLLDEFLDIRKALNNANIDTAELRPFAVRRDEIEKLRKEVPMFETFAPIQCSPFGQIHGINIWIIEPLWFDD